MSYNTRNSGRHMYSPLGRQLGQMGQRSPMGRGSSRMGRGHSRLPQAHSQQQQLTPIAPARPTSPQPKPAEPAPASPAKQQQSPPLQQKPVDSETNQQPKSAFDPSTYTQPAYTTQQAYASQQQIPVKQNAVQGAPAQQAQKTQQQPPQQQAQKTAQLPHQQDQQLEAQKPAPQQQQAQKPAQQQTPQPQQAQKPAQQQQIPQSQQAQKPIQQQQTPQPQQAQKPATQQQSPQKPSQQQVPTQKPAQQQIPTQKPLQQQVTTQKSPQQQVTTQKTPQQQVTTQKTPQQQVPTQKTPQQQVPTQKPAQPVPNQKPPQQLSPQKSPQERQEDEKPPQQFQQQQQSELMDVDQHLDQMLDLSKPENSTSKEEGSDDIEIVDDTDTGSGDKDSHGRDGKKRFGRPWYRKGGAGFNVRLSKKIRKRRQNARLRHILCPKNAMMVLHELHPELKIVATEQLNAANQMVYTVEIEIEGKTYRGLGMSKLLAKQAGCENALKAVLLEKMAKSNVKVETEPMKMEEDSTVNNGSTLTLNEEIMDIGESRPLRKNQAEDDVPWGSLASFALYKLFSEWQAQGYQLPVAATTNMVIPPAVPAQKMAPMKKIPEDANKKHPVQLLNQLRPGSQYSEKREGNPPNLTFTFTVVVDGQTYEGLGSNKKDAKKECAKSALIAMGVKYD